MESARVGTASHEAYLKLVRLDHTECAEAVGVSPVSVKRDWALARAWLNRELAS